MKDTIEKLLYISGDDKLVMEYEARQNAIRDEERRINSAYSAGVKDGELKGEKKGELKGLHKGRIEGKLEGLQEGRIEGKLEGLQEGELKKAINVAKKMKVLKHDISLISELTGLSESEINALD